MGIAEKKSITQIMRSLHRDIGYFVIGLSIIFSLSGLLLVFRTTDFMKSERTIEIRLPQDIPPTELGKALHLKDFVIEKTEGDIVFFHQGNFNTSTGIATYKSKSLPFFLEKLNTFHKASNKSISHILSVIFSLSLLFLAISSFWMYKANTKAFRRGIIFAAVGFVFALVFLIL